MKWGVLGREVGEILVRVKLVLRIDIVGNNVKSVDGYF